MERAGSMEGVIPSKGAVLEFYFFLAETAVQLASRGGRKEVRNII